MSTVRGRSRPRGTARRRRGATGATRITASGPPCWRASPRRQINIQSFNQGRNQSLDQSWGRTSRRDRSPGRDRAPLGGSGRRRADPLKNTGFQVKSLRERFQELSTAGSRRAALAPFGSGTGARLHPPEKRHAPASKAGGGCRRRIGVWSSFVRFFLQAMRKSRFAPIYNTGLTYALLLAPRSAALQER